MNGADRPSPVARSRNGGASLGGGVTLRFRTYPPRLSLLFPIGGEAQSAFVAHKLVMTQKGNVCTLSGQLANLFQDKPFNGMEAVRLANSASATALRFMLPQETNVRYEVVLDRGVFSGRAFFGKTDVSSDGTFNIQFSSDDLTGAFYLSIVSHEGTSTSILGESRLLTIASVPETSSQAAYDPAFDVSGMSEQELTNYILSVTNNSNRVSVAIEVVNRYTDCKGEDETRRIANALVTPLFGYDEHDRVRFLEAFICDL